MSSDAIFSIQRPIIKTKTFCPNPVAKYGIPAYADSQVNPKVFGSLAHQQWWEEQLYYIHNGYEAGGLFIPGRMYYFLNFFYTKSIRGLGAEHPDYLDFQYEYAMLIEEEKRLGKNGVIPKARRKGLSVMTLGMVVDYGWRFMPSYNAGVAAGIKDYSDDFIDKWKYNNMLIARELRVNTLSKNYDDIIAGWEEKNPITGEWEQKGSMNTIYSRTMYSDPQVFKGKFLNDVVFEESGEFDKLLETIRATKACLQWGGIQMGNMHIYGTGGNIKGGSQGFEKVWHHADDYNCLRYYVSGAKFYPPYVAGSIDPRTGIANEDIPNLMKFKDYERVGMEDELRAEEIIKETKKKLLKSGNLKDYWEYCKDYPGDIKEVFRVAASNYFPQEELNNQAYVIESNPSNYLAYRGEWVLNEKGERKFPLEVNFIPLMQDDPQDEAIYILNEGHPRRNVRGLYVGGADSYDQDKSDTSSSLGAMVVLTKEHSISNYPKMTPVCLIRTRPKRKEKFYEMCGMVSVAYNLLSGTLIDYGKTLIFEWYKTNGLERYLAKRPQKFESENSTQSNEYGVQMHGPAKPAMIGLLQTYYTDYAQNIWFRDMIDEALKYNTQDKDSDQDSVDALGIALMQMYSDGISYHDSSKMLKEKPFQMPVWDEDGMGNIYDTSEKSEGFKYADPSLVPDPFLIMIGKNNFGSNEQNDEDYD